MERRKLLTGAVGSLGGIALAATYNDARKIPAHEVRLAALERQVQILWQRNRYFHGHTTAKESSEEP